MYDIAFIKIKVIEINQAISFKKSFFTFTKEYFTHFYKQ